ncbi:MAG TPA: MFS transporter [Mycobacteriales bacterium]|nr:MFS transporter [Mycobacteriales bacterium]
MTTATTQQPSLPREVRVLVAVAFFVALGFGLVAPALPVFARNFGVGKAAAGAVISVFAILRIAFAFPAGRLVDRFGERVVMATGIGIVAVSSVLAGAAQSYAELIILRGAGGIGSAMFSISSLGLLVRMTPPTQRGRAMGFWTGGFLLGGITGPVVGGVIDGYSIRLPFFIYAATLTAAGGIGLIQLRATPLADRTHTAAAGRTTLAGALRNPAYRAALAANFADSWGAIGVRSALVPLFVSDVLHRKPIWTGIGFLVVSAINGATLLPAGRYADRVGRKPLLVAGCICSGAGIVVLGAFQNLAGYLIGLAVLGLGSGLLDVAPGAIVGDLVEGRAGPVFAAYTMSSDIGSVGGPVVAGAIADASYGAAFFSTAGILGVAAALAVLAPETGGASGQGPLQIGDQIGHGLDPDGQPNQVAGDLQG